MFSFARCTVGICLELDETTTDGGVDKVATTTMTKEYFEDLGRIAESNAKSAQEAPGLATEYWGRLPQEEQQGSPGHHSGPYGEHEASDGGQRGAYEQDLRDP